MMRLKAPTTANVYCVPDVLHIETGLNLAKKSTKRNDHVTNCLSLHRLRSIFSAVLTAFVALVASCITSS